MKLSFGDPVTNICAGEKNPQRLCYFVERVTDGYTNKFGIKHCTKSIRCTDKKGQFWKTNPEVIYPGHLDMEESHKLFIPIWEKTFRKPYPHHEEQRE